MRDNQSKSVSDIAFLSSRKLKNAVSELKNAVSELKNAVSDQDLLWLGA